MPLARCISLTLFALVGFALAGAPAAAQELPRKNNTAFATINVLRDYPGGGIPKEELAKAQQAFGAFAKYYADVIAHPLVHKAPTEFKSEKAPGGLEIPVLDGSTGILNEIDRYMVYPHPDARNVSRKQADYIREFGAALDATFKEQIETAPEAIVRINTARAYAQVCRSGAAAHYATVTAMLTNANVRPEIKTYMLQAAGALLLSYDPSELRTRRHSADLKTLGALVAALQEVIAKPELLVPGLPGNKLDSNTPADQFLVVAFLRRQAVQALAQCRFAVIAGPDGKTPIYPVHTLCRVALADPALVFPPSPGEAADAALGILNAAPVFVRPDGRTESVRGYNSEVALEAVTSALITFAAPRAARMDDRTLPWANYAVRLAEALLVYRKLFDPDFDPATNKYDAKLAPPATEEYAKDVTANVLFPMDKVDVAKPVKMEALRKRLQAARNDPKRKTELFTGVPSTSIAFAPAKAQ
jgi:hypothetical protein